MSECSPFEARDAREDDIDTHTDTDIEIELRIQAEQIGTNSTIKADNRNR